MAPGPQPRGPTYARVISSGAPTTSAAVALIVDAEDGAPVADNNIVGKGAREHNLANVDLELPGDYVFVLSGL